MKTLFFVDDNVDMLETVDEILTGRFNVYTFTNPVEALIAMEQKHADIVISDQVMPGFSTGLEFLASVSRDKKCVRILVSAFLGDNNDQHVGDAIRRGVIHDFVCKPFSGRYLIQRIEKATIDFSSSFDSGPRVETIGLKDQFSESLESEAKRELGKSHSLVQKFWHDIRAPISALRILSSSEQFEKEDDKRILREIVQRVSGISDSLARSILGKNDGRVVSSVDMAQICRSIVAEKELSSSTNFTTELFEAFAPIDATELGRIVSNLVDNAIEANASRVRISTITNSRRTSLTCWDNGDGISSEILEKLGKVRVSSKKGSRGTGTKSAAEEIRKSGGTLRFESEHDIGTLVSIEFPVFSGGENLDI